MHSLRLAGGSPMLESMRTMTRHAPNKEAGKRRRGSRLSSGESHGSPALTRWQAVGPREALFFSALLRLLLSAPPPCRSWLCSVVQQKERGAGFVEWEDGHGASALKYKQPSARDTTTWPLGTR